VLKKTLQIKIAINDLYEAIDCIKHVGLDIWCVERCVCGWSSWPSWPTSSSTLVKFSSVPTCFGLSLSCLWPVLPISQFFFLQNVQSFPFPVYLQKLCQYPPWTILFELV